MVTALGIDVRKAFTLVFAIGGALAGLAGALGGVYFGSVSPDQGTSLLVFGFVVVVIGGMGRTDGVALAAAAVGLIQQFTNYYAASGLGDFAAVAILAVVLLAPADDPGTVRANLTTFRDDKVVEMVHYPDPRDAAPAAGAQLPPHLAR